MWLSASGPAAKQRSSHQIMPSIPLLSLLQIFNLHVVHLSHPESACERALSVLPFATIRRSFGLNALTTVPLFTRLDRYLRRLVVLLCSVDQPARSISASTRRIRGTGSPLCAR